MSSVKSIIKGFPIIGDIALFFYRAWFGMGYLKKPMREYVNWLFQSRETTNLTYDLTELNQQYLSSMVAEVTGKPIAEIWSYLSEINQDQSLKEHIKRATKLSDERQTADLDIKFCRRIGWYALARAIKPSVIVETGVDKGLGSCVLTAALIKNAQEGNPGKYFGTDINPKAGYLLTEEYGLYGKILFGDSIASLSQLDETIDLFINDSEHSTSYEAREYEVIESMLSHNAVILGDNSHVSGELLKFAQKTGRNFLFFHEMPAKHWYPGAGIGIAFRR